MIIFESTLTTYQASFLEAAEAVVKIGFSLKSNHYNQIQLV
jgi:hypothetical protein